MDDEVLEGGAENREMRVAADGSDVDILKKGYGAGAHISRMARRRAQHACERIHETKPWGEKSGVIGAVVGRQGSLLEGLAGAGPVVWTASIGPLILRPMADLVIRTRWMTTDGTGDRIDSYMEHGYGQAKKAVETRRERLGEMEPGTQRTMQEHATVHDEAWIEQYKAAWAIDVIEGEPDRRRSIGDMARECGKEELYEWAYVTWSGAIHSSWYHVGRYNAAFCGNELHENEIRGMVSEPIFDIDYLFRGCKYLDEVLEDALRTERYATSMQEELIKVWKDAVGEDPRFEKRWEEGKCRMITARMIEFDEEGGVTIGGDM